MSETQVIIEIIKGAGITGTLVLAVWFLNREREKVEARREIERQEYRSLQNQRIENLETEIKECREDRVTLRIEISNLKHQIKAN